MSWRFRFPLAESSSRSRLHIYLLHLEVPVSLSHDASISTQSEAGSGTHGQIVKAFFVVGGAQVILILMRLVRGKVMALLLNPAGFGLFSVYGSIESMAEDIAGMGVSVSGVRQIAKAAATGDRQQIAQTSTVLKYTSLTLGLLGALIVAVFSRQISILTFGGPEHTTAVALLSLAVFLQLLAYGQDALIEGMRRIADFSKAKVFGFFFATLLSLPLIYYFRMDGVVPSLVILAGVSALCSFWYRRKIDVRSTRLNTAQVWQEASVLLQLGFVLMLSNLMQSALAYLVRALILHKEGLYAAGLYQSAWTLGGMYVGFIIKAMTADFYPRLTAAATVDAVCNRLVNEQAQIGLLLAGPGVMMTLTFCPAIVTLLYTAKFIASAEVLRWICLGAMLQVVTWPMGYIVVAKGRGGIFFWCELACATTYGALSWICIQNFGLKGAGIAFLGYCLVHGFIYYPITRRISGFRWTGENLRGGSLYLGGIAVVFCGFYLLPSLVAMAVGTACTILYGALSLRRMSRMVSWERIPAPLRKILGLLGCSPAQQHG